MAYEMTGMRRKMQVLAVAASMAFALVGGEYYVDANVLASGAGTEAAPFKTIQEAITAAEAGSTIHVAAGTYDSGTTLCVDGGYARVCVKKSLTIQGAGRDKSFIVGAKGSGTGGLGTGAVRCVAIEADDVVVSGFTICNGYTTGTAASSASGMGGGVYSHNKVNGFVVDCTIRNCCAAKGGAIARQNADFTNEGLAAVRCLITDNRASATNQSWCDYGASLYWCIVTRHYNSSCSPVHDVPKVVNCTFDNNYVHHYFQGTESYIYNTFAGRYSYKGGNGSDVTLKNVYFTSVTSGNSAAKLAEDCTFSGEEKQFVSPLANDLRPIPGAAVLSAGKGSHLEQIPEAYRTKDYEGTTVDPTSATIAVGAIQTPCTPASGMVNFSTSTIGAGDKLVFNGVTNEWNQQQFYWHATNWPSFARFKPLWANGTNEYGFASSGADSIERFPLTDGTYLMMPHPASQLTLTAKRAAQTFYADPGADASLADGTAEHPFATLQDAADAVASGGYAVIYAARGTYRSGGSSVIGGLNNRVAFQGRHIRLVGVEGAENTVIEGARDPDAGDDVYGCGANATRCLCASASGAVQGFTLTGGHAGPGSAESDVNRSGAVLASGTAFQVLDCIVSSNFAGRAAAGHGSTSHLLFSRSKIIGNRTISTGGSGAYTLASDFTSCLIANNWCGNVEAPVLGVGQSEQVYDCTVYSEGENSNFSGYGANANSGTHRNSIFMGFGAYRDKEVYGIVIDTKILNSTKTTYVKTVTGDYKSGKGFVEFVDAVNGDFRLLPTSPAVGYGSYVAARDAAAYRLATMSLDGVVPDFSGDGTFTAGAYRKVANALIVSGEGISPASVTVDPAPSTTVSVTATLAHKRPFLGFAVNGALQPFDGTGFTYTVPAGGLEEPVTITAVYDTHWYVDAVNGRDDGYGTSSSPLRRLCDALNYQRSGDTVHVAPGVYDEGTMTNTTTIGATVSKVIGSRAIVNSGVTLVSDEGADETFIVGAPDTANETYEGYGDGLKAVRCAGVYAGGSVKGFTLTGGRTSFNGIDDASCGGGVLCEDGTAVVEDCVISNCYALVGGGTYKGTLRRCRIVDCRCSPVGNAPAARYAHLFNCLVNHSRGMWTVADMYRIHSCTIGPDNTSASGGAVDTLYRMVSRATVNNCLLFGKVTQHSGSGTAYSNCIFNAAFTFSDTNFTTNNCRFVPTADFALDEDGRPSIGSSVAIDAGDATIYDADLLGDFDCEKKPRFVNGLKLDVGAFEADWKARYSKVLGRGVEVTDADPAAEERGDGVFLPDGTLALNWASGGRRGKRYQFDVSVSGTGTLTVLLNGEPYRSYTAASGAVSDAIVSDAASFTLEFAYTPGTNDNGGATLSHFQDFAGTMLIFR